MPHTYVFDRVSGIDAVFVCSTCGGEFGFNLPTVDGSFPVAIDLGDGTYSTPENPDQWSSPCTE